MFHSICGLYPLNVNSTSYPPSHNNQKCSQAWSHVPCRAKIAHVVENHGSKSSGRNFLRVYIAWGEAPPVPLLPRHRAAPNSLVAEFPKWGLNVSQVWAGCIWGKRSRWSCLPCGCPWNAQPGRRTEPGCICFNRYLKLPQGQNCSLCPQRPSRLTGTLGEPRWHHAVRMDKWWSVFFFLLQAALSSLSLMLYSWPRISCGLSPEPRFSVLSVADWRTYVFSPPFVYAPVLCLE